MSHSNYSKIVMIFNNHRRTWLSKTELAARLSVSERTVSRLLIELENNGAALKSETSASNRKAYQLQKCFDLPGNWFDASSIRAFSLMLELLDEIGATSHSSDFNALRKKLTELTHKAVGISDWKGKILIKKAAQRGVTAAAISDLTLAVIKQQRVEFHYRARSAALVAQISNTASNTPSIRAENAADTKTLRLISPQQLELYRGNWYLLGWCHARDAWRYFALERIADVSLVQAPATPGAALPSQRGYGIFDLSCEHTAILKFSAFRAEWVADESWHPDQTDTRHQDSSLTRSFRYGDATELVRDLMREGHHVQIIAPPALRDAVRSGHLACL